MFGQVRNIPPSTIKVSPVIQLAASEAKNKHEFEISVLYPTRCIGNTDSILAFCSTSCVDRRLQPSVSSMAPGHIPTTLMLRGPSSTAICLVKASTPALAVPAWLWKRVPLQCRLAEMLMMTPPFFMACLVVKRESKKVPTVSIISTVRKALADSCSKGQRKFPAAPLTRISISPCFQMIRWMVSSICFSSRTSQLLPKTLLFPVSAARDPIALLMLSILRLMMQTEAPCCRKALAMPQQIPVAPPLMSASFPRQSSGLKIDVIDNIQSLDQQKMINDSESRVKSLIFQENVWLISF